MSVAGGGWRVLRSSLVVLLVFTVVQILVCGDCKAGAIRVFPGNINAISKVEDQSNNTMKKGKMTKEALFHKYFSGIDRASNFKKTGQVYGESKRRVPSCPDQLHN